MAQIITLIFTFTLMLTRHIGASATGTTSHTSRAAIAWPRLAA